MDFFGLIFFLLGKKKLVNEVIRHFGIVGEANIQYALDPYSKRPFPALSLGVCFGCSPPLDAVLGDRGGRRFSQATAS